MGPGRVEGDAQEVVARLHPLQAFPVLLRDGGGKTQQAQAVLAVVHASSDERGGAEAGFRKPGGDAVERVVLLKDRIYKLKESHRGQVGLDTLGGEAHIQTTFKGAEAGEVGDGLGLGGPELNIVAAEGLFDGLLERRLPAGPVRVHGHLNRLLRLGMP